MAEEIVDLKYLKENLNTDEKKAITFLKSTKPGLLEHIDVFKDSFRHHDWDLLRNRAHQSKGLFISIGALKARKAAEEVEVHIRENHVLKEPSLYLNLLSEIEKLVLYVDSLNA